VAGTQAVYYRDARGAEPVDEFIQALPSKRAAKIDDFVQEHLNGQPPEVPPPPFPAIRRTPLRAVGKDAPPASRPL
jgi:hypothetical protein